jgi:ferredoxin
LEKEQTKTKLKKRVPVVDLIRCSDCDTCIDLCPEVFRRNPDTGRIEVADLSEYPEELIGEIISNCPRDCVEWEED